MNLRSTLAATALFGALALAPSFARADVAPPDQCTGAGTKCNTAGPDYKSPGICTDTTCQKATPDGSTSYACTLCMPSDGGSGTGGSTGTGGSAGSTGTGGSKSGSSTDSGGCSIGAPLGAGAGLFAIALGLGAALALRRRQSR